MATIFSLHNPTPEKIEKAFRAAARMPMMHGHPEVSRAVAHALHKVGSFTGYLLTGIALTRVVDDVVASGLVNSAQRPDAAAVVSEYYAILGDGLYTYPNEGDEEVVRWRTEYRMV